MISPIMPGPVPGRRPKAQDRLATGSPTYGAGGSNAPTSGTVDPTGYVERSRRSGLARSILARTQTPTAGPALQQPGSALVGETASRTDPRAVARTLAARMRRRTEGG